jgi:hypothetical protein
MFDPQFNDFNKFLTVNILYLQSSVIIDPARV